MGVAFTAGHTTFFTTNTRGHFTTSNPQVDLLLVIIVVKSGHQCKNLHRWC